MVNCSAFNCSNHTEQKIRLFRFPTDKKRRSIWAHNCGRDKWEPSVNSRLCEVHFDSNQWETNRKDGWLKLKPNAIPTLFNIPIPPLKLNQPPHASSRSKIAVNRILSKSVPDVQPYSHVRPSTRSPKLQPTNLHAAVGESSSSDATSTLDTSEIPVTLETMEETSSIFEAEIVIVEQELEIEKQ